MHTAPRLLFVALGLFCLAAPLGRAEIVDKTPDQLRQMADLIVTARVQALYSRTSSDGRWKTTHWVAELAVQQVEKGRHGGKLAYARYWHRVWVGPGDVPPSTAGHRGLPAAGDVVRVHLQRGGDGGLDVILPNGFARAGK